MPYITIISDLINGVKDYFMLDKETRAQQRKDDAKYRANERERADRLKEAQALAEVARIERGDVTERDYDMQAQRNAEKTIIDDIMIFWVLGVVTCLFIPALAPYAIAGFAALAGVPYWFQVIFVGCFIAKLGLRFLFSGRTLFGKVIK